MSETLMIKGQKRPETIVDNEQFARLLDERLGYDAAEYFRRAIDPEAILNNMELTDKQIIEEGWCSGECDKVQRTQEHFENLLRDCGESAKAIYAGIMEGYEVGRRRTKKEQLALDKAIEIMKVVNNNL